MVLCAGQYQGTRWATPVLAGLRVDEQINVGKLPGECVWGGRRVVNNRTPPINQGQDQWPITKCKTNCNSLVWATNLSGITSLPTRPGLNFELTFRTPPLGWSFFSIRSLHWLTNPSLPWAEPRLPSKLSHCRHIPFWLWSNALKVILHVLPAHHTPVRSPHFLPCRGMPHVVIQPKTMQTNE